MLYHNNIKQFENKVEIKTHVGYSRFPKIPY